MSIHEKINSGVSACAVIVSILSAVVSCSSQQDVEKIKQSYSYCNAKVEGLNTILQTRFREIDNFISQTAILTFNPNGLPTPPTDTEKLRLLFSYVQGMGTTVDSIWREARPYMTGQRREALALLYKTKWDAFTATMEATNAGRQDPALGTASINAMNTFTAQAPGLIGDEIEATLANESCGVSRGEATDKVLQR